MSDQSPASYFVRSKYVATVAERQVLGSLLLDPSLWHRIEGGIQERDFVLAIHQRLYHQIERFVRSARELPGPWPVVLRDLLNAGTEAEDIAYMVELAEGARRPQQFEQWVELLQAGSADFRLRPGEAIKINPSSRGDESRQGRLDEPDRWNAELRRQVARLSGAHAAAAGRAGIATGIGPFDRMTGGLYPGQLVVIGARPAMGKSTLAINWARHIAVEQRRPIAYLSNTMTEAQFVRWMIAREGRIDRMKLRLGEFDEPSIRRAQSAEDRLRNAPISAESQRRMSLDYVQRSAAELHREQGLDVLFIDDVQGLRRRCAARRLKELALDLDITIVVTSQLGREIEGRESKRPRLEDIEDCPALEELADLVVLIYRHSVYDPDDEDRNRAELIVAKHDEGPEFIVAAEFQGQIGAFGECPLD